MGRQPDAPNSFTRQVQRIRILLLAGFLLEDTLAACSLGGAPDRPLTEITPVVGEDSTWRVVVLGLGESQETILQNSEGYWVEVNPGSTFLVVKATVVNLTARPQRLLLGRGMSNVKLTDQAGNSYTLTAYRHMGYSVANVDVEEGLQVFYLEPSAPDGSTYEFFFAVPKGTAAGTFFFDKVPPISLQE